MASDGQMRPDIEEQSLNNGWGDSAQNDPDTTTTATNVAPPSSVTWIDCFIDVVLTFLFFVLVPPIYVGYVLTSALFRKDKILHGDTKKTGTYKKIKKFVSNTDKMEMEMLVGTARVGCVLLGLLILSLCVPSLRSATIKGSLLWKWSLLAVIISLGYFISYSILVGYFVCVAMRWERIEKSDGYHFLESFFDAVMLAIHCAAILLVWKLYFGTEHGLKPSSNVDAFVTWTLVSLLVGAILAALKRFLLLHLEENAMYRRFKPRILLAGVKLYFLQLILDEDRDPFLMCRDSENELDSNLIITTTRDNQDTKSLWIQDYVRSNRGSLHQIKKIAVHLMGLAEAKLRGDDRLDQIRQQQHAQTCRIPSSRTPQQTQEYLQTKYNFTPNETRCLSELLNTEHLSHHQVTTDDALKKWLVEAHISYISLGETLLNAKAMLSSLNKVLTLFIVVVVIFLWLIIMGLAKTNIIVLITSPLLATTFVFGDTCKAFFQGVIFSFVRNPFDVGDHCIIDDISLEVKNIGILSTAFIKIGTKEKISYPNSDLSNKRITNLEGIPNPKDLIELLLDSSTTKLQISDLKKKIKDFLDKNQLNMYEKDHQVRVKEITTNIKIIIEFTHFMNVQDVTHSEYAQKKINQRSEFFMVVKGFLDELDIKIAKGP